MSPSRRRMELGRRSGVSQTLDRTKPRPDSTLTRAFVVVRDGVDPSTSGFSDRLFQWLDLGRCLAASAESPSR